jgi:pimeloyl-ACP methyl ester carboxylesterase
MSRKGLGAFAWVAAAGVLPGLGFLLKRRARKADAGRLLGGAGGQGGRAAVGFAVSGPRDAAPPVIVLLPGAGDTAASWVLVEARLNRAHRVLTYERAPVGVAAAGDGHLAAEVQQLDDVLDAAGLPEPVLLVGHSFGGLLARAYAAAHPDRVAGLVLVDATPPAVAEDPAVAVGFAVSATVARVLRALAPFGVVRTMIALHAMPLYPEQRRFRRAVSAEAYRRWAAAAGTGLAGGAAEELAAVLPDVHGFVASSPGRVGVPVGVVHSRAYGPKWERMQGDVASELGAVSVAATGERDHNIHMSRPELVERSVLDVLAALQRGERPFVRSAAWPDPGQNREGAASG